MGRCDSESNHARPNMYSALGSQGCIPGNGGYDENGYWRYFNQVGFPVVLRSRQAERSDTALQSAVEKRLPAIAQQR